MVYCYVVDWWKQLFETSAKSSKDMSLHTTTHVSITIPKFRLTLIFQPLFSNFPTLIFALLG